MWCDIGITVDMDFHSTNCSIFSIHPDIDCTVSILTASQNNQLKKIGVCRQ
jgi:hypothetical protein